MRIEHAGFDVPRSKFAECVAFYRDAVGMEVVKSTEEPRYMAFVACPGSPNDHDLAIFGIDDEVLAERRGHVQGHLAIDLECGEDGLKEVFKRFQAQGLPAQLVDHSISLSFYTLDPAGNRVELLSRKMTREEGREHFRNTGGTYQALDGETYAPVPRRG